MSTMVETDFLEVPVEVFDEIVSLLEEAERRLIGARVPEEDPYRSQVSAMLVVLHSSRPDLPEREEPLVPSVVEEIGEAVEAEAAPTGLSTEQMALATAIGFLREMMFRHSEQMQAQGLNYLTDFCDSIQGWLPGPASETIEQVRTRWAELAYSGGS